MGPQHLIALSALAALASSPLLAQESANELALEQVLDGFEESAPAFDEVLQGFDGPSTDSTEELHQVLGGFEDDSHAEGSAAGPAPRRNWRLGGAFTQSAAWNYAHAAPDPGEPDFRGLSRMRSKLGMEIQGSLGESVKAFASGYLFHDFAFAIQGRDQYSEALLDSLETEAELGETWLRKSFSPRLDLTLGRQIVVWGKSDNLRITDIVNPLDNREPGIVDIEDLRLPLTMAKLDWSRGPWAVSAMAIPEIRFNKNPPFGSDFYPLPGGPLPEEVPGDGGANTEYAAALKGFFSGWDLSLHWAQVFDDQAHRELVGGQPLLRHSRLTMVGAAANLARGPWLLKGEAAHFSGLRFSTMPGETRERTDVLLGVEYAGFRDTSLSFEVADRHIHDYGDLLATEVEEDDWQMALRYTGDFLHARLQVTALWAGFGPRGDDGGFTRLSASYELANALTLTAGVIAYRSGDRLPFNAIDDNDRVFGEVKYSF